METNTEYQRQTAEILIRSIGVEEAADFALQNRWMGVLAHLLDGAPSRLRACTVGFPDVPTPPTTGKQGR